MKKNKIKTVIKNQSKTGMPVWWTLVLTFLLLFFPKISKAIPVLEALEPDSNSFSLSSGDNSKVNFADCLDDVFYTIKVSVDSNEDVTGRELYLYRGSSCDSSSSCHLLGTSSVIAGGYKNFEIHARDIAGIDSSSDCKGTGSTQLWAGLLENESQSAEDGGIWSNGPLDINYDFDPPDAPFSVEALFGENKVKVSWDTTSTTSDAGSNDDHGARVLYVSCDSSSIDGGTGDSMDAGASGSTDSENCEIACQGVAFSTGDSYMDVHGSVQYITVSAGEETEITGLSNDKNYKFAVVLLDDYNNPSLLSETTCATPGEVVDLFEIYRQAGGKAGGEYCFIATAAFGSYDHEVVRELRKFRDNYLKTVPGGTFIVNFYYRAGPALAGYFAGDKISKQNTRFVLTLFSGFSNVIRKIGPGFSIAGLIISIILGLFLGAIFSSRKKKDNGYGF